MAKGKDGLPDSKRMIDPKEEIDLKEGIELKEEIGPGARREISHDSREMKLRSKIPREMVVGKAAVSYTHLTLPTTPYV